MPAPCLDSHPQLELTPGRWFVIVPDGPCFDGGVDFVFGPYPSGAAARDAHDRLRPWPCRLDHADPVPPPGAQSCDCVILPAFSERRPA